MHRSLVLFLGAFAAQAASVLDTWQGAWTPYRMTDDQGRERRLLKATIDLASPRPGRLLLRDSAGAVLDTEHIPRARKGRWAHGF
jgi:hypothetical protein